MQVKDLELFVAIINEKSITKAAERLYMAQSTASRRIVEMETELGHPLLYRSTHGLTITAQGEKVYLHAQKVLEEYSKLLESLGDAPIPRLSIGFNRIQSNRGRTALSFRRSSKNASEKAQSPCRSDL
ncbi:MAG: LysR family transcriptional regulator [Clostridiales bacterium]|nr:LysR family transcriptional regulator [Clostridiales bacterium]